MYFISVAGRNYNIAIAIGTRLGGTAAAFSSRLETCLGPLAAVSCDIDINYHYEDVASNVGNKTITLLSGSSGIIDQPTGNVLTVLYVNSLTGYGCTAYNTVYDCPGPLPTTTTSTTVAPTTTTTTTIAPVVYSSPVIKHDQYSSSYSNPTWTNVGSAGSTYNLTKNIYSNINTGGSGTGVFLGLTGSLVEELFVETALYGSFINLYNKSFSYATVFRVEAPSLGYTISSVRASSQANGFGISGGSDTGGPFIQPYLYKPGSDLYGPTIRVSTSPKWYLGVLTFDKTAGSSDAAKFYLNLSANSFTGIHAIPTPSTFFNSDAYYYNVGTTLNPIKLAAATFWENTVLTQAQIQALYNEYNTRYGLG